MAAVIVLWLLCGVLCAVIAANKGKSGVAWFFLGCILGIFGIILIAVLPSEQPTEVRVVNDWPSNRGEPSWAQPRVTQVQRTAPVEPPVKPVLPPSSVKYDAVKWQVLKEVDPDIAGSASRVAALGAIWEDELASKYLTLNDKSYLSAIETQLLGKAREEEERLLASSREEQERRRNLEDQHGAALVAAAEEEARKYKNLIDAHLGLDPRSGQKVISIEPYFGTWAGFRGGIKVTLANGQIVLRQGAAFREFSLNEQVT